MFCNPPSLPSSLLLPPSPPSHSPVLAKLPKSSRGLLVSAGSSSWEEEREGEREGMAWVTWSGESCERGEGERGEEREGREERGRGGTGREERGRGREEREGREKRG